MQTVYVIDVLWNKGEENVVWSGYKWEEHIGWKEWKESAFIRRKTYVFNGKGNVMMKFPQANIHDKEPCTIVFGDEDLLYPDCAKCTLNPKERALTDYGLVCHAIMGYNGTFVPVTCNVEVPDVSMPDYDIEIGRLTMVPWSTIKSGTFAIVNMMCLRAYLQAQVAVYSKDDATEAEETYQGGMVLTPTVGLTNGPIEVFDFRSMYPSIVVESGICLTTVRNGCVVWTKEGNVLPYLMQQLLRAREKEGNPVRKQMCKLLANTMYGIFGSKHSRMYSIQVAAAITNHGRAHLRRAMDAVYTVRSSAEIIYGDTDSLMIAGLKNGDRNLIMEFVNKPTRYLKLMHQATYVKMLIWRKKKYALLCEDGSVVCKGLQSRAYGEELNLSIIRAVTQLFNGNMSLETDEKVKRIVAFAHEESVPEMINVRQLF